MRILPVGASGVYFCCSSEESYELKGRIYQTEFDMNKVFVSPREWAGFFKWFCSGVLMPTRCGNLFVYVTV
jgi:hypothetical protein